MATAVPTPSQTEKPLTSKGLEKSTKSTKGKGKETAPTPCAPSHDDSSPRSTPPSTWDWRTLTSNATSNVRPLFTKDGSYFFSLADLTVRIHSVTTGEVISTLSSDHSSTSNPGSKLTSAMLNPQNAFQLIVGSSDGRLMIWDFLEAILLKTIYLGQSIYHICAHESIKDTIFVSASRPNKMNVVGDDNAVVLRVSLKSLQRLPDSDHYKSTDISRVGKTRVTAALAFSPSGNWLIALGGRKAYVARASALKAGFIKYVSPERLTCLAIHPFDDYFATGDDKGNIRLWYCLNDNVNTEVRGVEKRAQTTAMHWHAHRVSSIAFTTNGAYLLSGGEESVLVIWQLHTGKKEFMPRVGAPIQTVSVLKAGEKEEEYLLGLADATYLFVSAGTLRVTRSYSRLKIAPSIPQSSTTPIAEQPTPLVYHNLSSTLILPSSHSASLQIYSPSSSKLVSELEVSPSNRVSRRDEQPIADARIQHISLSPGGDWMATLDVRDGDLTFRGEIYLKFWSWDQKRSQWSLNTRVDQPHGLHQVKDMAFSPVVTDDQLLQLVTVGEDGNIKSWRLQHSTDKAAEVFWVTRASFRFRTDIPHQVSWSPDGSLLSVTLTSQVALYDPITNALRHFLTNPGSGKPTSAHFIGPSGRYLTIVADRNICLWDLVTQTISWQHTSKLDIDRLLTHPNEEAFALFQRVPSTDGPQTTRVSTFTVSSSEPAGVHNMPFELRSALQRNPFRTASAFTFIGVMRDWRIIAFGEREHLPDIESKEGQGIMGAAVAPKRTLFRDIFGASAFTDAALETPAIQATPADRVSQPDAVFFAPAYLMPPLESLFDPLLTNFLKSRVIESRNESLVIAEEDNDVEMEDDTEATLSNSKPPKLARVVDREEMDMFVELFKQQTLKQPPPSVTHVNGNGRAKNLPNGTPHQKAHPPSASKQNGHSIQSLPNGPEHGQSSPESSPPSSPVMFSATPGRKRKKLPS